MQFYSPLRIQTVRLRNGPIRTNRRWSQTCTPKASSNVPSQSRNPSLDFQILAEYADADFGVELGQTPLGRGLLAAEPFSKIHAIDIPIENTLLVPETPPYVNSEYLTTWQRKHGSLPPELLNILADENLPAVVRLALWLLWVRRTRSGLWRHYCSLLPREQEYTSLLSYSREESAELQVATLRSEAEMQREYVREVHVQMFNPKLGVLRKLGMAGSLFDTLWAVAAAQTRAVSFDVYGQSMVGLVPLADMANHSFEPNCEQGPDLGNEDHFRVWPLRPVEQGEEVTVAYVQAASNADLMRDYGFVVPGNPWDVMALPGVDKMGSLHGPSLLQALGWQGSFEDRTLEPLPSNPMTPVDLYRTRSALLSLPILPGESLIASPPRGEQLTCAGQLLEVTQKLLKDMPTSLQADADLLCSPEAGQLTPRHLAAVRCRLEYKQLLASIVWVLQSYLR